MAILLALALTKHSVKILEATTSLMFLLSQHINQFCHAIGGLKKLHLTIVHTFNEREVARLQLTHEWDNRPNLSMKECLNLSDITHDTSCSQKWTFRRFLSHAKELEDLTIRMPSHLHQLLEHLKTISSSYHY